MRVLVVEDDVVVGAFITMLLTDWGIEWYIARDGAEALDWLRVWVKKDGIEVDGIVLDLLMEPMGGAEFMDHKDADDALRDIPVILMTAHPDEVLKVKHEACAVVYKPGVAADLKKHIDHCFKKPRLEALAAASRCEELAR